MNKAFKLIAATLITALMAACGGGGGDPVTSSASYNLDAAWANSLNSTGSRPFTITGRLSGVDVTGSGTEVRSSLSDTTFEGLAAKLKSVTASMSLTANGQTFPLSVSVRTYVSPTNVLLGSSSDDEYSVVQTFATGYTAVKVGFNAQWYVQRDYANSSKSIQLRTTTATVSVEADTESTAILKHTETSRNMDNSLYSQSIATVRITPSGGYTLLSSSAVFANGDQLNLTY